MNQPGPPTVTGFSSTGSGRAELRDELAAQQLKLRELRGRARVGTLMLVYSARDTDHNDAVVLAEILRRGKPAR
jgi:uncharacterized protein YeaO (DUF488 family)